MFSLDIIILNPLPMRSIFAWRGRGRAFCIRVVFHNVKNFTRELDTLLCNYYRLILLVIPIHPGDTNTLEQSNYQQRDRGTVIIKYLKDIESVASNHA